MHDLPEPRVTVATGPSKQEVRAEARSARDLRVAAGPSRRGGRNEYAGLAGKLETFNNDLPEGLRGDLFVDAGNLGVEVALTAPGDAGDSEMLPPAVVLVVAPGLLSSSLPPSPGAVPGNVAALCSQLKRGGSSIVRAPP